MAKILIKNGPPELDMIYAYFRQCWPAGRSGAEVEMTFSEEGDGMANVHYVELEVMIPWTDSTRTWKFRAYVQAKEDRVHRKLFSRKYFVGTYSFKTRTGEGMFVNGFGQLRDIQL